MHSFGAPENPDQMDVDLPKFFDEPASGSSTPSSDVASIFSTTDTSYFPLQPTPKSRPPSPSPAHHQDSTPILLPADHHITAGFASLLYPPKLHVSDCQYRSFLSFISRLGSSAITSAEAEYLQIDASLQRQFLDAVPQAVRDGMWRDIDSWTYGEATRAHARFTVDHDVTRMREGGVNGWRCGFVRDVGVRRDGTQYTFLRSLTHREVEEGTRRLNRREMLLELREQRGMRVPRLAPAGNGRLLDGIGVKVAAIGRVLRKWQAEAGQSRIYDKKWEFIIKPTWYAERPFPSKLLAFVALGKDEGFVGVEFVDVKDLSWIVQKAMDQLSDEGFTIIQPKTYLNALYYRRKLRGIKAMGAVPNLPSLPISPADRAISLVRFEGIAAGLENIAGKPEVRHRPIAPDPNTPPTPTRAQSASKKTRPISYAAAAASANPPQAQTYAEQCNTDPRLRPATDLFGVAFPPSSKSAIDKAVAAANKAAQLVKKTATITKRYAPVMPLILRPPNKKVRVDSAPPVNVSTLREDEAAGEDTRMADGGLSEAQKLRRTTARHTDNWRDPDPAGNTNGSESDDIGDMSRFIGMDF